MQTSPPLTSSRLRSNYDEHPLPPHQHYTCDIIPCPDTIEHEEEVVERVTTARHHARDEEHVVARELKSAALSSQRRDTLDSVQSQRTPAHISKITPEINRHDVRNDVPTRDAGPSVVNGESHRQSVQLEDVPKQPKNLPPTLHGGAGDASCLPHAIPAHSDVAPSQSRRPHRKRFQRNRLSHEQLREHQVEETIFTLQTTDTTTELRENVECKNAPAANKPTTSGDLAQQQQLSRASVDSLTDVSDFDVSLSFSRCVASNSRHSPQKQTQTTTSEDDARMVSGAIVRSDTVELRSSQQWQSQTTTATTTSVSATVTEASHCILFMFLHSGQSESCMIFLLGCDDARG